MKDKIIKDLEYKEEKFKENAVISDALKVKLKAIKNNQTIDK
jgi:hypothetical protein